MKAQSAVEYLTTYGWMFVSLVIVSGVIYSFVGGGQCVESTTGFTSSNVQVQDFGTRADSGNLSLLIESRSENQITIQEVNISDPVGSRDIEANEDVPPGGQTQLGLRGFKQSDSCTTMDIEIIYEIGTLEGQYLTGEITSNIKVTDEEMPESLDSVNADLN